MILISSRGVFDDLQLPAIEPLCQDRQEKFSRMKNEAPRKPSPDAVCEVRGGSMTSIVCGCLLQDFAALALQETIAQ
ncbi:MAG: hypothetical protein IID44_10230 [Planctomycetes bacterium]|nr:hypothetical protein [Planctomycetota bacterium]